MVGEVMLKVLEERNFPVTELLLVASERSVGKKLTYKNLKKERHLETLLLKLAHILKYSHDPLFRN